MPVPGKRMTYSRILKTVAMSTASAVFLAAIGVLLFW
jgi:hypothetical protein